MATVRKHIDEIPPMSEERAKELEAMSDEDIDYSDIPSLDEEFFKNAKLVKRKPRTEQISMRVDTEVLDGRRAYRRRYCVKFKYIYPIKCCDRLQYFRLKKSNHS